MVDQLLVKFKFIGAEMRTENVKDGVGGARCRLPLSVEDGVFMEGLLGVDRGQHVVIGIVKKGEVSLTLVHLNCNINANISGSQ